IIQLNNLAVIHHLLRRAGASNHNFNSVLLQNPRQGSSRHGHIGILTYLRQLLQGLERKILAEKLPSPAALRHVGELAEFPCEESLLEGRVRHQVDAILQAVWDHGVLRRAPQQIVANL
ncbi:hypothetical protein EGW08_002796, partial [Elysia chlorotica]